MYETSNANATDTGEIVIPNNSGFETIEEDIKKSIDSSIKSSIIIEKSFGWYVLQVHSQVMPLFYVGIENFLKIFANSHSQHFVQMSKELISKYITNVKKKLKEIGSDIGQFCCSLLMINEDLCKLSPLFSNSNNFHIVDRFTELFEFLIRFQIEKVVENLQKSAEKLIIDLYQEITNSTENLPEKIEIPAEKASFFMLFYLLAGILNLEPILDISRSFLTSGSLIVSLIISHILNFFQILRKNLCSFSSNSTGTSEYSVLSFQNLSKNGNFLIGLLKFLIFLEESVPKIITVLLKTFSELKYDRGEVADIMNRIAKPELLVVLKLSQEDLLLYYIEHYSKLFNDLIVEYCSEK